MRLFSCICVLGGVLTLSGTVFAQNSTRKIRQEPGEVATQAGSFVDWRKDLDAALKEARRSKKPVFWYLPTVADSFMDRQPEIDRYMMAGPFSWPALVELLNEEYIPVRAVADRKLRKRYGIAPVAFIEPGFLVLSPKGKEQLRRDRISTFHPSWFAAQLGQATEDPTPFPGKLPQASSTIFYQDLPQQEEGAIKFEELLAALDPSLAAEACWLYAAGLRDLHQEEQARALLQRLIKDYPDHMLSPKAAMELEGHGPYWRGFESYDPLPASALVASASGTLAPRGTYQAADIHKRSTDFLLRCQEADGSWRDSRYDFGGTDSLPNVYAAVTAINARALLAGKAAESTAASLERAMSFLADDSILNLEDRDELIWVYLYRTRLYCRVLDLHPEQEEDVRPLLTANVEGLLRMQAKSGAWFHEYENPFVTASCLIALHDASQHGVEAQPMEKVVERGLVVLEKSRSQKGAYSYSLGRGKVRTPVEASVGRSPLGEHARQLWDVGSGKNLERAVANSFRDQEPLFLARKYDDHTDLYAYGGFFFWYAMLGRTEAILALPDGARRKEFVDQQRDLILALPEIDGVFVDSHELGRSYGTGMALWCLDLLGTAD